jgi:hypothetical protein
LQKEGSTLAIRQFVFPLFFLAVSASSPTLSRAQETPYVVAYDHHLEERAALEVEYSSTFGTQRRGDDFHAFWTEFEYGATNRWTTGMYLEGQSTFGQSTIFTGFRFENRFRPLKREHFVNPVLYVEYERKNGADKILKEIEGHDTEADFLAPNAEARKEHINELELKLILSSNVRGWNFTQNTLAAKNLANHPWEFGYALGASHALAAKGSTPCSFCRQNLTAGVEMYGGLGDRHAFGLRDTSHYVAPVMAWSLPSDWSVRLSAGFGLNDNSRRFILRWGVSRDIDGFGSMVRRLFGTQR